MGTENSTHQKENTKESLNNKVGVAEERISKIEDNAQETAQSAKQHNEKYIFRVLEGAERKN